MTKAYQLTINGYGSVVAATFEDAVEHLAYLAFGPEARTHIDEFPDLEACGLQGSRTQRIRYAVESLRNESVEIIEHDMSKAPQYGTQLHVIDFVESFDPASAIQSAMFAASDGDYDDLEDLPYDIRRNVADDIHEKLRIRPDGHADIVEAYRKHEIMMGGIRIVPEGDDAEAILKQMPDIAFAKMTDMLKAAYPEELKDEASPKP